MIGPDDAPRPRPSAASAIQPAIDWTRWVLFTDANAGKWFAMGFCAFLANLGQGGGSGNFNFGDSSDSPFPGIDPALDWIRSNPELTALIGLAVLALICVMTILLLWLSSRGKFMLLDGIVKNRGAVREPWRHFVYLGNSLCGFRLVLSFGIMFIGLSVAIGCAFIAWPDIQAERFGDNAMLAIAMGATVMAPLIFLSMILTLLLEDFIVPIMVLRNVRTLDAFSIFSTEIARGRIGSILRYYLLKFVLAIMTMFIILIGILLTCCIAGCFIMIPYIGSVILLPISVFFRCYSIFFIEQFGPEWRFFAPEA